MTFDLDFLRGVLTAIILFSFIGIWLWAWSKKRIPAFNEAANLPFADEAINQHSGQMNNDKIKNASLTTKPSTTVSISEEHSA